MPVNTGVCAFALVTVEPSNSIVVNPISGTFSGTHFSGFSPKVSNFAMFSILEASTILI